MKKLSFLMVSIIVFAAFNYSIYAKEQIKANGETVFLALAPVDPRSLMQGDYMRLRYSVERDAPLALAYEQPKSGDMVIAVDANHLGTFRRFHGSEPLQPGEKLLHYHHTYGAIHIVPDSFMFQEGQAELYRKAKYGVFKFDNKGEHMLVGLADDDRQIIAQQ